VVLTKGLAQIETETGKGEKEGAYNTLT